MLNNNYNRACLYSSLHQRVSLNTSWNLQLKMRLRETESHSPGMPDSWWRHWNQSPFTHRSIYSLPRTHCIMKNGWQRLVSAPSNFQCEKDTVRVNTHTHTHTQMFSSALQIWAARLKLFKAFILIYNRLCLQELYDFSSTPTWGPGHRGSKARKQTKQRCRFVYSWEPRDECHDCVSLFHSGQDLN